MNQVFRTVSDKGFREEKFLGGAVSYRFWRFWSHFALEAETGLGHRWPLSNSPELWAAGYVRFDGFPWQAHVHTSLAVSTGFNWMQDIPHSELPTSGDPTRSTARLLHYFAPELTFALPDYKDHEIVIRMHHRSGVWGTFGGVWGASDVLAMGYRYRF